MRTYVERYNGERKEVKNLGWLVKNASRVTELHICHSGSIATGEPNGCTAGILWAYLDTSKSKIDDNPQHKYATTFASWDIMYRWIRRPCLAHVQLIDWNARDDSIAHDMRRLMNGL
jgi:hypothetical protein